MVGIAIASICFGAEPVPAIDSGRLAFNLGTTVASYKDIGSKRPSWDDDAIRGLTAFAQIRSTTNGVIQGFNNDLQSILPRLAQLGCDDPLVRYLYTRYIYSTSHSEQETSAAYKECAKAIQSSRYPPLRKFYTTMWAYRLSRNVNKDDQDLPGLLDKATSELAKALEDRAMPASEADDIVETMMSLFPLSDPMRWECFQKYESALTNNWKGESFAALAKGQAYLARAWNARGTGYANTVDRESWKQFAKYLAVAADSLEEAWRLNPRDVRIPIEMIHTEMGQGKGRERMETWFRRGIELDPSNYDLCYAKIEYLRPRWYGTAKDIIDFGRECTFNTNYAGSVRLLLADAHLEVSREIQDDQERGAYWRQKGVWPDVQATFEQFFKLYPQEVGYRHNYARYAYRCGEWKEFLKQVRLFPTTNHVYFGGKERFDDLVQHAKMHLGPE